MAIYKNKSPKTVGPNDKKKRTENLRRKDGVHYTNRQNIHKVIDPLFLNDLREELLDIKKKYAGKKQLAALLEYQDKLESLTFLDPACGNGNFLTETYISLRRLENEVLAALNSGNYPEPWAKIKVKIGRFYGIEIDESAVEKAKEALLNAEHQMLEETQKLISKPQFDFSPIENTPHIVCANALRVEWTSLTRRPYGRHPLHLDDGEGKEAQTSHIHPKNSPSPFVKMERGLGGEGEVTYIIGNPPFVGKSYQTAQQKADMALVFKGIKNYGYLDYAAAWFKKAADFISGRQAKCAFVATNSICQGIAVPPLWQYLFSQKITIDFAHRTFIWDRNSGAKAHVSCVIIGFSAASATLPSCGKHSSEKLIYNPDGSIEKAKNINAYLLNAPNLIIENRAKPLASIPEMIVGSCPTDGGAFILSPEERAEFLEKEPLSAKYIRQYMGSDEFINGKKRYCLWLKDLSPAELLKMPLVLKRVEKVRSFRLASPKAQTRRRADTPTLFAEDRYVPAKSIFVPMLSSEKRKYVPIGFIDKDVVANNLASVIPEGNLFIFGIITSKVSMAWLKTTAGRLEMRYRFSATTVYNTLPWCNPTNKERLLIEKAAEAILKAREKYNGFTLAELYGEKAHLFPELVKAHEANDRAVMAAYAFAPNITETEIVAELFKMYEKMGVEGCLVAIK